MRSTFNTIANGCRKRENQLSQKNIFGFKTSTNCSSLLSFPDKYDMLSNILKWLTKLFFQALRGGKTEVYTCLYDRSMNTDRLFYYDVNSLCMDITYSPGQNKWDNKIYGFGCLIHFVHDCSFSVNSSINIFSLIDPYIVISTRLPKNKFFRVMYRELKENLTVSEDKTAFLLNGTVVHGIIQCKIFLPLKNNLRNIGTYA